MFNKREETRASIISLYKQNKRQTDIVRLLGVKKSLLSKAIKRFKELGNTKDHPRSGRPCTANTPANCKIIRERIQRNYRRSMRKLDKEIGVDESSVRRILKNKFKLKSLKLQKGQHLNDKKSNERKKRYLMLKRRHGAQIHKRILFSDEKYFNTEQAYNVQNGRVLSPGSSEANKKGRIVSRTQKPTGVMVWAGKTNLIFVENGVKINANNYINTVWKSL
ncbi:hypothetical protein WH47_06148 [Habropoda laboriosa]|uniref:Insertion element IS150 protein InsJ-like helix-turn-helix domain-containing protein n=1 Tax=Habropoda laboriosa TaxID=597456 RepID=A0A0L7QJ75_9HYME|nr:hypothetical protein WH47_06148 [Habropoda laboriosa]